MRSMGPLRRSATEWIGKILNGSYVPNIEECAELAEALEMGQKKFYEIFLPQNSPNGGNGAA